MKTPRLRTALTLGLVLIAAVVILCLVPTLGGGRLAVDSAALPPATPMPTPMAPTATPMMPQEPEPPEQATPHVAPPAACGGNLSHGVSFSQHIVIPTETCRYTFSGTAGDKVTIKMNRLSGELDPFLRLQAPNGEPETKNDDGGGYPNSLIRGHVLEQTGSYVILAHSYNYKTTGGFEITLEKATSGGCGGDISYGSTVTGNVPTGNKRCFYKFQGQVGQVVTIRMTRSSTSLDPLLRLFDPYGDQEASDDDGAGDYNSLISDHRLGYDGTYTILAVSYRGSSSGPFELSLSGSGGGSSSCGGSIRFGDVVPGELPQGGGCRYTFNGTARDLVTIRMTKRSSSLDPLLELRNPSGSLETWDDDGGGDRNSLIYHRLARSGQYTIVTKSYNDSSSGSFTLSLE
ncbi:MAG: hypothetical protein JSV36_16665 [Anaerolineae bacterium]|nr:MAG: hypothetical protein JSV36_16665 [Anaerolineae bacterium]